MPVYNDAEYLSRAIESILNQTYSDFKFLIYDDGSTDGAVEKIKSFNDERITLIEGKENKGGSFARSYLINAIDTKYCMWCDADDKFAHNQAFQIAMDLEKHGDYDWISFPKFYMVHDDGTKSVYWYERDDECVYEGDDFFKLYFLRRSAGAFNSKIFKSELLKKCIPEEKYMMKKYATHDIFFNVMWYFHTKKYFHTGLIEPMYVYYSDIGFTGLKKNDCSIERTKNIFLAYHDCLCNAYDKMTAEHPLSFGEINILVKGLLIYPLKTRMKLLYEKCSDDVVEEHIKAIHEYFFDDGVHVLSDSDIIENPSIVRQLEGLMRRK
jgi:glycosyltransferase involved in cell wall biosynthesis